MIIKHYTAPSFALKTEKIVVAFKVYLNQSEILLYQTNKNL